MPWGFPGLQAQGESVTSTDPELRDPGEPSEFQGLEIHPGEDPLMVQTGLVQGHQRGGWNQSRLSTKISASRMEPLPLLRQAPKGWSVLPEGDLHQWRGFRFAITWHIPLLFKNSKVPEWVRKSREPFRPQTKTIQVKPQTCRKTFPGKTARPTPLNGSSVEGQS